MPTTILQAPGFSYYTSIGSLHFKDVLSKDRKVDQFGSIFIQQNKVFVILAPAKALKKLSPSNILKMKAHFENKSTF